MPPQAGHVDSSGRCALVHAAQRGHLEALCLLLKHADWSCTSCCGQRGASRSQAVQQALTAAANMGHTEVRRSLARALTHLIKSGQCDCDIPLCAFAVDGVVPPGPSWGGGGRQARDKLS